MGAPFDARPAAGWAFDGFWQFMKGAASIARPPAAELSRRYAELLAENLGQPGYRELIMVAHDLDSRRDLVFALLADSWRKRFLARAQNGGGAELIDLAGAGRVHVADALAAALTPPVACAPHEMAFAPESFWRGETHRLCDRPSAAGRLLHEAAEAGVTQVIVVSSNPPLSAPHALTPAGLSPRDRIGEALDSLERGALADAVTAMAARFHAVYEIRLAHNALNALAFGGATDQRSDRAVALAELVERGYEDAYRQFVDPIVGASGEQMHGATVVGPTPLPEDLPLKPTAGA
jgi:hypothetical protein